MQPSRSRGFTLSELILGLAFFAVLTVTTATLFRVILLSASGQLGKIELQADLQRGLRTFEEDFRRADAHTLTVDEGEARLLFEDGTAVIYYAYHPADGYPPAFTQSGYELRRANLSGGIAGTFTYGAGTLVAGGFRPPPVSGFSETAGLVTADWTLVKGDETLRSLVRVRRRNA